MISVFGDALRRLKAAVQGETVEEDHREPGLDAVVEASMADVVALPRFDVAVGTCLKSRDWNAPRHLQFATLVSADPLRDEVVVRLWVRDAEGNNAWAGTVREFNEAWETD